jgi:hypothetical protein
MKRLIIVLLVLGFLVVNSRSVFAAWFSTTETAGLSGKAATSQVVSKTQNNAPNAIRDMIAKKRLELDGTTWIIDLTPMSGSKGKGEKDTLSFSKGTVSSKNLVARGYAASNFSLRMLEDNTTYTWETMQVSDKEGKAFWRGDISSDGIMRGVVSIRNKKNAYDSNFVSENLKKDSTVVDTLVTPPVATPVTPATQQQ